MINAVPILRLGYAVTLLFLAGCSVLAQFRLTASIWSASSSSVLVIPSNETSSTIPTNSLVSTTFRPFEWNFLDMTKMGLCGMRKCFFRSRSTGSISSTSGTPEGYLVAKHDTKDAKYDYLDRMMRTWDVANRLEKEQNMSHFLLQPPEKVEPPPLDILKLVNALALPGGKVVDEFYGNGTSHSLVVQKVKVAPSPALIPRCYFTPKGRGGRFFFDTHSSPHKDFDDAIEDKDKFMNTFKEELQDLITLLAEEKRLWNDFQFLVDSKGLVHHIDLDRIEQSGYTVPNQNAFDRCFGSIIGNTIKILDGDYSDIKKKKRKQKQKRIKENA